MLVNCDIWALVDFGKGNVEVRCTEVGDHDEHVCVVPFIVDEMVPAEEPTRQNIFEQRAS